ncbi:MAG TPA: hypothetical protein VHY20_15730, partial [Pirellulales bacterium]|nr:hypothetical protein [Pirellulales bacterium]
TVQRPLDRYAGEPDIVEPSKTITISRPPLIAAPSASSFTPGAYHQAGAGDAAALPANATAAGLSSAWPPNASGHEPLGQ